jgi:hypothetical protein
MAVKLPRAGCVRSMIWWKLAKPLSSNVFLPWLKELDSVQVLVSAPL